MLDGLAAEFRRIALTAEVKERLGLLGLDAYITPRDEFSALIRQELDKYAKLVRAAGIPPE